jgi:pimeloyl-ACP methyl ester carboxylesterase
VLDHLAKGVRLLAPSHPGFGHSALPGGFTTVDDLAYFYLDLLDVLDLRDTVVVGVSLGAWIAAAIAVKSTARIAKLVLQVANNADAGAILSRAETPNCTLMMGVWGNGVYIYFKDDAGRIGAIRLSVTGAVPAMHSTVGHTNV